MQNSFKKYNHLLSRSASLLFRLFIAIKALLTSYLSEALDFEEVNLSYKQILLKSSEQQNQIIIKAYENHKEIIITA